MVGDQHGVCERSIDGGEIDQSPTVSELIIASALKLVQHHNRRRYTRGVATTRPRHSITETDDVAAAIAVAAERWPGESRAELLRRLVQEGRRAIDATSARRQLDRLAALRQAKGALTGVYRPDEIKRLRDEWPA